MNDLFLVTETKAWKEAFEPEYGWLDPQVTIEDLAIDHLHMENNVKALEKLNADINKEFEEWKRGAK